MRFLWARLIIETIATIVIKFLFGNGLLYCSRILRLPRFQHGPTQAQHGSNIGPTGPSITNITPAWPMSATYAQHEPCETPELTDQLENNMLRSDNCIERLHQIHMSRSGAGSQISTTYPPESNLLVRIANLYNLQSICLMPRNREVLGWPLTSFPQFFSTQKAQAPNPSAKIQAPAMFVRML